MVAAAASAQEYRGGIPEKEDKNSIDFLGQQKYFSNL